LLISNLVYAEEGAKVSDLWSEAGRGPAALGYTLKERVAEVGSARQAAQA
jgi:hypothetical protein